MSFSSGGPSQGSGPISGPPGSQPTPPGAPGQGQPPQPSTPSSSASSSNNTQPGVSVTQGQTGQGQVQGTPIGTEPSPISPSGPIQPTGMPLVPAYDGAGEGASGYQLQMPPMMPSTHFTNPTGPERFPTAGHPRPGKTHPTLQKSNHFFQKDLRRRQDQIWVLLVNPFASKQITSKLQYQMAIYTTMM